MTVGQRRPHGLRRRTRALAVASPLVVVVVCIAGIGLWISQVGAPDDSGAPLAFSVMLLLSPLLLVAAAVALLLSRWLSR